MTAGSGSKTNAGAAPADAAEASAKNARADAHAAGGVDPARAAGRLDAWRLALAREIGEAPAMGRDEPRRTLAMLNVFGWTRRTAEAAMLRPSIAAAAAAGRVDETLDAASADLDRLAAGSGDPHALNQSLAPVRARIDLALDIAEISGWRTVVEATEARTWFAERILDIALGWLIRAAIARGELSAGASGAVDEGVFILGGGDFATRDLAGGEPVEAIVVYGGERFAGAGARMAERAFVRIGAELREVLNGGRGEPSVLVYRSPLGDGVNGQGVVEGAARVETLVSTPQMSDLAKWLAGARVVAGDLSAGSAFLERIDDALWNAIPAPAFSPPQNADDPVDDPHAPFDAYRRIAQFLRWREGPTRPCFRAIRIGEAMAAAADCGLLTRETSARLVAGAEFALTIASRAGMVGRDADAGRPDVCAVAALSGYSDPDHFRSAVAGAIAQADETLAQLTGGAQSAFAPFRPRPAAAAATKTHKDNTPSPTRDAETLERLGFEDGAAAAATVDGWAVRFASGGGAPPRFAAVAPGLLTAFGETRSPDDAARLFDRALSACDLDGGTLAAQLAEPDQQAILANALGDFGGATEPLIGSAEGAALLLGRDDTLQPRDADEFFQRFGPDALASIERLANWRRLAIARVAALIARADMNFDAAVETIERIDDHTLADLMSRTTAQADASGMGIVRFARSAGRCPGDATSIGLVSCGDARAAERAAGDFLARLSDFGEGPFALAVTVDSRHAGEAGRLVATPDSLRSFLTEHAIAQDRVAYARARILGSAEESLSQCLRGARRSDATMRDLDRARAQRLRQSVVLASPFDQPDGGVADIDLIIGALALRHAPAHPGLKELPAPAALDALVRADLLSPEVARTLAAAHGLHSRLGLACGLSGWREGKGRPPRRRFGLLLARAAGVADMSAIRPLAAGYAEQVRAIYAQLAQGRPSQGITVTT